MNKTNISIDSSIYEWLAQAQNTKKFGTKKYDLVLENLTPFNEKYSSSKSDVLVVGGGNCEQELSIISRLGLQNVNLFAVDHVKPTIQEKAPINKIHWIPGAFEKELVSSYSIKADILMCLGTSRYFHNALEIYEDMFEAMNPGALIIVDFYEIPPLRRSITDFMRGWLKKEWSEDSSQAIKKLEELANISMLLSEQLGDKQINLDMGVKEMGIDSGILGLQQLIYESIFPFWFRSGASITEVAAQLAWLFLCESNDYSLSKIENLARTNTITIEKILNLNRDTHILVGRTPYSD